MTDVVTIDGRPRSVMVSPERKSRTVMVSADERSKTRMASPDWKPPSSDGFNDLRLIDGTSSMSPALHQKNDRQDLNRPCQVDKCICTCFNPDKQQPRRCRSCLHGWLVHVLDKQLNREESDSTSSVGRIYDVAGLILYGTQAIPVRLKLLLDRLFATLYKDQILLVLSHLGWTFEDYSRGYIYMTLSGVLESWIIPSLEEEVLILQEFLKFKTTKPLAEGMFVQLRDKPENDENSGYENEYRKGDVKGTNLYDTEAGNRPLGFNGFYSHPILPARKMQPLAAYQSIVPSMGFGFNPFMNPLVSLHALSSPPVTSLQAHLKDARMHPLTSLLHESPLKIVKSLQPPFPEFPSFPGSTLNLSGVEHNNDRSPRGTPVKLNGLRDDNGAFPGKPMFSSANKPLHAKQRTDETPSQYEVFDYSIKDQTSEVKKSASVCDLGSPARLGDIHSKMKRSRQSPPNSSKKRHWQPIPGYGGTTVSPSGKKRVLCTACNKTFCDKGALKIHYSAVHLKEMHRCTIDGCDMMFSSRRSRNRHSANPNPKLHSSESRLKQLQSSASMRSDERVTSTGIGNAHLNFYHDPEEKYDSDGSESSCSSSWMTMDDRGGASSPEDAGRVQNGRQTELEKLETFAGALDLKRDMTYERAYNTSVLDLGAVIPDEVTSKKLSSVRKPSKRKTAVPTRCAPDVKPDNSGARNYSADASAQLRCGIYRQEDQNGIENKNQVSTAAENNLDIQSSLVRADVVDQSDESSPKKFKRNLFGGDVGLACEKSTIPSSCLNGGADGKEKDPASDGLCLSSRTRSSSRMSSISEGHDKGEREDGDGATCIEESDLDRTLTADHPHGGTCSGSGESIPFHQQHQHPSQEKLHPYPDCDGNEGDDDEDPQDTKSCGLCGKQFHNHFSARLHYQNVHLKLMHVCKVAGCNAAFPSKRSRDRHSANVALHVKLLSTVAASLAPSDADPEPNSREGGDMCSMTSSNTNESDDEDCHSEGSSVDEHAVDLSNSRVDECCQSAAKRELPVTENGNSMDKSSSEDEDSAASNEEGSPVKGGGADDLPSPRPDPEGAASCHICFQNFRDNLVLKEHLEKVHPKQMYLCSVTGCNKIFSTRKSRNRHSQNENLHRHLFTLNEDN